MDQDERTTSTAFPPRKGKRCQEIKGVDLPLIQSLQCSIQAEGGQATQRGPFLQFLNLMGDLLSFPLQEAFENLPQHFRTFLGKIQRENVRNLLFDSFRKKDPKVGNDSILADEDDPLLARVKKLGEMLRHVLMVSVHVVFDMALVSHLSPSSLIMAPRDIALDGGFSHHTLHGYFK
jgi:hypothetical protein